MRSIDPVASPSTQVHIAREVQTKDFLLDQFENLQAQLPREVHRFCEPGHRLVRGALTRELVRVENHLDTYQQHAKYRWFGEAVGLRLWITRTDRRLLVLQGFLALCCRFLLR